ncbi:MAG: type II CAAX endopeptidase family protein [Bryobacteraceae bacterium]|jgi:membrane protease YdiL (CAAX protease family)
MTDPSEPPPLLPPPLEAPPEPERVPFWGYRDLMFLIAVAFVLLMLVGRLALVFFKAPVGAVQALAVTFAFEGLWFVVLYGVMRLGYGRPFWRSLAWVKAPRGFWDAAGWGLLTALTCVTISSLLPTPHVKTPMEELLKGRSSLLLMGFFAVTLGPLFEELAFRGFLQPLLVSTFGAVGGVLLQAVPFAALHGAEYAWSWQQLIVMLLAGSAFGWMRHRTGSTAASTYMHAGFNFVVFLGMLAESLAGV